MSLNKRSLGSYIEKECVLFLQENDVRHIQTNFGCKIGEIDIIGYCGIYLTFFEVKFRKNEQCGLAESAVDYYKQKTICRVSDYYMVKNHLSLDIPVRYDVLAVNGENIVWYKNAFDYIPSR